MLFFHLNSLEYTVALWAFFDDIIQTLYCPQSVTDRLDAGHRVMKIDVKTMSIAMNIQSKW